MDNQSGSECPRRRRLRYTASLFYFIYGCCFEREELRFFFEFRRRVNALAKREGKTNKKRRTNRRLDWRNYLRKHLENQEKCRINWRTSMRKQI